MRVIAGSARRLLLEAPRGTDTRPTTDKTKETLFNCLMPYIGDASFLDLFAGSGAIGIEALSRGAKNCIFVEKAKDALKCIENNLKTTHLSDKAQILRGDVLGILSSLEAKGPFDIIFMDPPFNKGLDENVMNLIAHSKIADNDSVIVIECSNDTDLSYLEDLPFETFKIKEYKSHKHIFLRKVDTE